MVFSELMPTHGGLRGLDVLSRAGHVAPPDRVCANCGRAVTGPGAVPRGRDTAWHLHCGACHELSQLQLELEADRPGGAEIWLYRCRLCGDVRSCRPGWHTRCHACLDDRTDQEWLQDQVVHCISMFAAGHVPSLLAGPDQVACGQPVTARMIVQAASCLTVAERLARFERRGWTIVATDVWGLPWLGVRTRPVSHGTWGRHDACGTFSRMRAGSVDCPVRGPQPGSRTHRARKDDPYLLYVVSYRRLVKFGVGTENRVREHQRANATVIQVLRASFADVVLAERALKTTHAASILNRRTRRMPLSFGHGTEVLRSTTISLTSALPNGDDVTSWFTVTGNK